MPELAKQSASACRGTAALLYRDTEEMPQAAAGQSTEPSFQCPRSACQLMDAAFPIAVGTPALVSIAWSSALASVSSGKI